MSKSLEISILKKIYPYGSFVKDENGIPHKVKKAHSMFIETSKGRFIKYMNIVK